MGSYNPLEFNNVRLRHHKPGDMGWITHRHAVIYAENRGFDERFEAVVSRIGADFLDNYNPDKERCWIAEKNGKFLGCIMLVQDIQDEQAAKLRCLLVEEDARGLGVGSRLVEECLAFARHVGYKAINLSTESRLLSARRLYARVGFTVISEEKCEPWGVKMVQETWRLEL